MILGLLAFSCATVPAASLSGRRGIGAAAEAPAVTPEFVTLSRNARKGDLAAQYQLGRAYQLGQGVPRDGPKAERWLTRAAQSGSLPALVALGELHETGGWLPADAARARQYYIMAAERQLPSAFLALGRMYRAGGPGVAADLLEAYKWLSLAAAHGQPGAERERRVLTWKMNPRSLESASLRANQWIRVQQEKESTDAARTEVVQRWTTRESPGEGYRYQMVDVHQVVERLAAPSRSAAGHDPLTGRSSVSLHSR